MMGFCPKILATIRNHPDVPLWIRISQDLAPGQALVVMTNFQVKIFYFFTLKFFGLLVMKGAGNIKYRDIKNGEIEKTGTSKMKQREYREKNNGNIERKTTAILKLKSKTGK